MARHSFIRMSKLPNVKGRISYITSPKRQEHLYATCHTTDPSFWENLAREGQQEFKRSGAKGKCIEARELVIALPEVYTQFDPDTVLKEFTEAFHKRYGVECVSALHHNKRKTNYHIHLIFSERTLLPDPEVKIATRSVFFDETGKRVRTKKEITDEDGNLRAGCTVFKKGEIYESHMFSIKDDRYKSEPFLQEAKQIYTNLINSRLSDPAQHLKVFDPNGVYLPTKKIGKNNPKEAEIKVDNAARQEWNRMADVALVTGISEEKIIEIKETEILDTVKTSIDKWGWLPDLFCSIVGKAKDFLQALIREQAMPPKPTLDIDMTEFRIMRNLMIRVQNKAKGIKHLQDKVLPGLKQQLADTKGMFKGKERKALTTKIEETEESLKQQLEEFPEILKTEGYPDVQAFMRTFRQMEVVVEKYNHDLAQWERQTGKAGSPPEKESVREKLRQLQQQGKQKHARKKSFDQER